MADSENKQLEIDHRKTGAYFFNQTWDLLDKRDRNEEEKQRMIHTAHASLLHWMNAPECTPTNLSIGYWQLSRVYAVAQESENALKYANICMHISSDDSVKPFYKAYAYEAMSRALILMDKMELGIKYLNKSREFLPKINEKDAVYLKSDLNEIEEGL